MNARLIRTAVMITPEHDRSRAFPVLIFVGFLIMIFNPPTYKMAKCDVTDYHMTPILAMIGFKKKDQDVDPGPFVFHLIQADLLGSDIGINRIGCLSSGAHGKNNRG